MKYQITNERLNSLILNYLNSNLTPDYGWASSSEYKKILNLHAMIEFYTNDDDVGYYYNDLKGSPINNKNLSIEPWLYIKLNSLFSDYWIPVFKEWFEANTKLKVLRMICYGSDDTIEGKTIRF